MLILRCDTSQTPQRSTNKDLYYQKKLRCLGQRHVQLLRGRLHCHLLSSSMLRECLGDMRVQWDFRHIHIDVDLRLLVPSVCDDMEM